MMLADARSVRLAAAGIGAAEELASERNMRANVTAESDRLSGSARSPERVIAVGLGQAVEERRVTGMMRHADEIGLCQVNCPGLFDMAQEVFDAHCRAF